MNVLEALDTPGLFAPHFKGNTWQPWRAFLATLFALPLDDAALPLYRAHTGRQRPPTAPFTEAALIVGRRGGKSRVLALAATFLATFRDYTPHLAAGEVATVGVLASDRRQAGVILRYIGGLLDAVPPLKLMVVDRTDEAITLNNRVVIEVSTASFRATRGFSYAAVLCDEVAFWRSDEASANPDVEILRAIRPGMASIPGSILLLASSPYAKRGALYTAFRRHYGKDDARVLVWKADTASMNPRIDPAIIAEAYETDPEAARAEYGAEFRDDLADFVTREAVDLVTAWGRSELPPEPGVAYSAFCDPSGGANDSMTLGIGHMSDAGQGVLDVLLEIRPPFNPDDAVAECTATMRRYGISRVVGDRYGGEWPRSRFSEHGIDYEPSARPKSDLYGDLLPLLNAKRIELLEIPRLTAQLTGLERRTARSGRDSIDHAPGGHDDVANAAAGVLVGLDLDRRRPLVRAENLTVGGAPVGLPRVPDYLVAVLAVASDGSAATVYGAAMAADRGHPLIVADFDVAPLDGGTLARMRATLAEMAADCRPRLPSVVFVPPGLVNHALAAGLSAVECPLSLIDAAALALEVAVHISDGRVKIAQTVAEKARTSPWGGALAFRAGDKSDTPLRTAALQLVAGVLSEAA